MSNFSRDHNRVVWTDIPVIDLERAVAFYRAVLEISVDIESYGDVQFAVLGHEQGNGGCLVVSPEDVTDKGTLNYYNAEGRLQHAVDVALTLGGVMVQEIHAIGPHGFRAILLDSEGNKIALHSEQSPN